jgi:hypothetical protein
MLRELCEYIVWQAEPCTKELTKMEGNQLLWTCELFVIFCRISWLLPSLPFDKGQGQALEGEKKADHHIKSQCLHVAATM